MPERNPLVLLGEKLDDLVSVSFLSSDARVDAEIACWSTVYGFSMLHTDGALRGVLRAGSDRTTCAVAAEASEPFDDGGVGHAMGLAHGLDAVPAAGRLEVVDEGGQQAGA